ncbi:hypothetical protein EVAR_103478_1 [Eumeta japonica]|uniref:Uncharacterized protein n=1 Tax=Eumeta variegata TaxID=151549 RepID=A0A4C1YUE7_EUMVA|nr:hypothetical protein EVAR_103478_1 [Eumeta japonica]
MPNALGTTIRRRVCNQPRFSASLVPSAKARRFVVRCVAAEPLALTGLRLTRDIALTAGTYQEQTEKIISGLAILAPPESTPCAWAMAPPYLGTGCRSLSSSLWVILT